MNAKIPNVAHELFAKCQKVAGWIKKEGLDREDLQAATEFAGDLVQRAQELHEFLTAELARQRAEGRSSV